MMGRDGEQIWLRQSASFTVNGETRTVEIALPLRPGATAEEIESLLSEADGGMERLTRHLDARVAALRGESFPPGEAPAPPVMPAPARVASEPVVPITQRQPVAEEPVKRQHEAEPAVEPRPEPATTISALRERTGLSLVRETPAAPQPATTQPEKRPTAASASGSPLTLQDFLKETMDEFGYTPRTVMEKLGVRSLSGVNYREALETLRRQAIRDGSTSPAPSAPTPASTQTPKPSATSSPRYFDEELDEPEIVFSAEDDEDEIASGGFGPDDEDGDELLDDLGLEEEIASPPPPPPTRTSSAARARSSAAQPQEPAPPPAPPADPADVARARVAELVAQLRSPQAGGVPSSHQRTAYRNIVVQELGEEKAKALVAGLYRVTPERLGPEQIDELVSWGKRDTFADDADLVLAALRAERAAQQAGAAGQTSTEQAPTPRASRTPRA